MADTTTAAGDQASSVADTSTPGASPTTSSSGQAPLAQQDYDKIIADLRKENAQHRTKLKAFEDQQAAADLAKLGDLEKANKQLEQAQAQLKTLQEKYVDAQVRLAASEKFADTELAAMAVKGKLEYGDDGLPTNLDKALDELAKNKPLLLKQGSTADAPPVSPATPNVPAMNPGRSQIAQPGTLPTGKVVTFNDLYGMKRQ